MGPVLDHFILYTGAGSLVLVLAASAVVAVVVWSAVSLAAALIGRLLWRLAELSRAARDAHRRGQV
jgi:hypothetical protein